MRTRDTPSEDGETQWLSGMPKSWWPTEPIYVEEIQPRLSTVTIAKIASILGISEPYAAQVRAGVHRPHPRHWHALADLVGIQTVEG